MKKFVAIAIGALTIVGLLGAIDAFAAASPPALGGTGTSIIPASGTVLIGNGAGTYTPAKITAGTNIQVTNASGSVTIAVTGTATGTVYVLNAGHGISLSPAQITASGTIAVNTSTLIADVVASGQFLASSTTYVVSVNGQSGAVTLGIPATTTINSTQASVFRIIGDGTTVTSTVSGATTTFSIINTGNWAGTWQGVNSSTFYLASNPNAYISLLSLSGSSPISFNTSTGAMSFVNPGFVTAASSVTWTAAQIFNATATFNSSTIFGAISGTQCLHTVNGLLTGTGSDCGSGGGASTTVINGMSSSQFTFTAGSNLSVATSAGPTITYSFTNPGFVTAASSVTWTAAITHTATTTFQSSTLFSFATGTLLSADANGKLQTTSYGGTGLTFSGNTLTWTNPGYITSSGISQATATDVAYYAASTTLNGTSTFTFTAGSGNATATILDGTSSSPGCFGQIDQVNSSTFGYMYWKGGRQFTDTNSCQ